MTTDYIQNKHILMRSRIARFRDADHDDEIGLELTRLENFLDGRQDIFDVLEKHAANKKKAESPLDIPKPSKAFDKPKSQPLDDFWSSLKAQLRRLREEEKV